MSYNNEWMCVKSVWSCDSRNNQCWVHLPHEWRRRTPREVMTAAQDITLCFLRCCTFRFHPNLDSRGLFSFSIVCNTFPTSHLLCPRSIPATVWLRWGLAIKKFSPGICSVLIQRFYTIITKRHFLLDDSCFIQNNDTLYPELSFIHCCTDPVITGYNVATSMWSILIHALFKV